MTTLIYNCRAVLMDGAKTVLDGAFVAIDGEVITSVGIQRPAGSFDREIDAAGQVLMPGLVNTHSHLPMTLMRGYGGGCNLQDWLNQYIFPAEAKLDGRAVRAATSLGLAEMIASGISTTADMYYFCDEIAQETVAAGLNLNLARGITVFPDEFDFQTFPSCVETRELVEKWHGFNRGQVLVDASIHGEYTSIPALWESMATYAKEKGLGIHVHVSETQQEQEACIGRWGKTPIQTLDQYGVWDVRAIAAHCVWTTPEDWALMAEKGVSVAHCPMSNLKLGSGIAPLVDMRRAGVNITLGTDGVSSNNCCNMFSDLKLTALLQAGANRDPMALSPYDALQIATVNGARALGRNGGQIAPGCSADLILLDFDRPHLTPCHDVIENLVYSAQSSDVTMNMVRGKVIYQNGTFFTIDLERVKKEFFDYAFPLIFG